MCCCLLCVGSEWSPALTLPRIFKEIVLPCFIFPDFKDDCMNLEFRGQIYDEVFIKKAREWTLKYAM